MLNSVAADRSSMEPVRSSLGGGAVATVVLTALLVGADLVVGGPSPFLFATFVGPCAVGGPPYCGAATPLAAGLTAIWYGLVFGVAWPLLFGGFTWGLPGESGATHGAIFGLFLWAGYAVGAVLLPGVGTTDRAVLAAVLAAYLVYGLVLGTVYDRLADHRTFLDAGTEERREAGSDERTG